MSLRDDLVDAAVDLFKADGIDDLADDRGIYDYEEGDDWDHKWTGPDVGNSVMAREDDDGWTVQVGNGQELFSQNVLYGASEEEAASAVEHVTDEYQGDSPMDEGWITMEDADDITAEVSDLGASDTGTDETDGSDTGQSASDEDDAEGADSDSSGDEPTVGESEAPGDNVDADGEESTDLGGQSVDDLMGAVDDESADEGEASSDDEEPSSGSESAETDPSAGGGGQEDEQDGEGGAQNPWVQYRGDAGGEGWQNTISGEIRYQESRPAPTEAEEEQMAQQDAVVDEESGLSEGDPVTVDLPMQGETDGVIVGTGENEGGSEYLEVDTGDEDTYSVTPDMLSYDPSSAAQQEPSDGFADGWQAPPDDWGDIESGAYVEFYDEETGEWKQGEALSSITEDDLRVRMDDGETEHVFAGEKSPLALTAVEETGVGGMDGVPIPEDGFDDLEPGDNVLFDSPGADGLIETEVVAPPDANGVTKVEDYDGEYHPAHPDDLFYDPPEWRDWAFGDDMDTFADFEGEYVKYNHPSRGVVSGPLTVQTDAEGDFWFHVDGDDNGQGQNCSGFTSKDGHPLSPDEVDVLETDDPFDDWKPGDLASIKAGDKFFVDGEVRTAEFVDEDGFIVAEEDTETYVPDFDMAEEYDGTVPDEAWIPDVEQPDPPDNADEWEEPPTLDDADGGEYYQPGDMVWFETDDHEAKVAEVADTDQYGDVQTLDGDTIPQNFVQGHAATGTIENQVDFDEIHEGDMITYQRLLDDGSVAEYDAVINEIAAGGDAEVSLINGDSGTYTINPMDNETGVVGHNADYDPYDDISFNGEEMGGEEIADTIMDDLGFDIEPDGDTGYNSSGPTRLSKAAWWHAIGKSQQQNLRGHFKEFFPEEDVDYFYDAIYNWKSDSGPTTDYKFDGPQDNPNQRIASAFAHALGVESPVRGSDDDEPQPYTEEELGNWTDMAEAASELSQRFFVDNYLDGDGNATTTDISRGGHGASFRTFMDSFLENPDAEKYTINTSAFTNFEGDQPDSDQNTWKKWSFAPEVSAGHIGLATDYMFNPGKNHQSENEIWVSGDNLHVDPANVALGEYAGSSSRKTVFDNGIEGMNSQQADRVAAHLGEYWNQMRGDVGKGLSVSDDWSEEQVKTLNRLADQFEKHNVAQQSLVDDIRSLAGEFGVSQADWKEEADDDQTGTNWDPVSDTKDLGPGDTVRVTDENVVDDGIYTVDYVDTFGDVYLEEADSYVASSNNVTTPPPDWDDEGVEYGPGLPDGSDDDGLPDDLPDAEPVFGPENLTEGHEVINMDPISEDDPQVTEVVDVKDSGTVELANGTHVVQHAVGDNIQLVEGQDPPSDGAGDFGPDAVEEGQPVTIQPEGSGEMTGTIDGNVDSDTGPTVTDENGESYQVMWDEITDVDDDWADVPSEGETVTVDTEYDVTPVTGTVETVVSDEYGDEPVLEVAGVEDGKYESYAVEASDVYDPMDPQDVAEQDWAAGEQFLLDTEDGPELYEFWEQGMAEGSPDEVKDTDGDRYLLWPDGSLEAV